MRLVRKSRYDYHHYLKQNVGLTYNFSLYFQGALQDKEPIFIFADTFHMAPKQGWQIQGQRNDNVNRQKKTKLGTIRQNKAEQGRKKQNKAGHGRTRQQGRTGQDKAEQDRTR